MKKNIKKNHRQITDKLPTINKKELLIIYLKGFLMGVCDLIPGISGGTIAFISGIYERLINSIKNITPKNYFNLIIDKKNLKKNLKKLDILFLILLFAGIFSAILSGANLISFLLENYFIYLISFFIGLVLASSLLIFKEIEIHSNLNFSFAGLGFILGFILLFISPLKVLDPTFFYILFGGFMAIFALFLPGISGSFILLILGLYEYIINLVKNHDFVNLLPFAIGAILSVGIISRLVHYLFEKDKCKTLYFLFGLVLGTLFIPIVRVFNFIEVFSLVLILKLLFLFLIGFGIVFLVNKIK